MFRNGVRASWAVLVLSAFVVGSVVGGAFLTDAFSAGVARAMESASDGRRPLTEEEGQRVAEAALAFANLEFTSAGGVQSGMPYVWGGRTTVEEFSAAVSGLGVDASGVAVNSLRSLGAGVRFAATAGDAPTWWADATSTLLYNFNVVAVDPSGLRAGDLVFFGESRDGDVSVSGVGVVTGRAGTRVDFVVASAREGRVIHTFARTDGDYWQSNIVGAGRFLVND